MFVFRQILKGQVNRKMFIANIYWYTVFNVSHSYHSDCKLTLTVKYDSFGLSLKSPAAVENTDTEFGTL